MNDVNTNPQATQEFKEKLLELEKESLSNISQFEDQQMVNKIIKIYEELKARYENK